MVAVILVVIFSINTSSSRKAKKDLGNSIPYILHKIACCDLNLKNRIALCLNDSTSNNLDSLQELEKPHTGVLIKGEGQQKGIYLNEVKIKFQNLSNTDVIIVITDYNSVEKSHWYYVRQGEFLLVYRSPSLKISCIRGSGWKTSQCLKNDKDESINFFTDNISVVDFSNEIKYTTVNGIACWQLF